MITRKLNDVLRGVQVQAIKRAKRAGARAFCPPSLIAACRTANHDGPSDNARAPATRSNGGAWCAAEDERLGTSDNVQETESPPTGWESAHVFGVRRPGSRHYFEV